MNDNVTTVVAAIAAGAAVEVIGLSSRSADEAFATLRHLLDTRHQYENLTDIQGAHLDTISADTLWGLADHLDDCTSIDRDEEISFAAEELLAITRPLFAERARNAGDPVLMTWFGELLEFRGESVRAEEWYIKAAELGHVEAMRALADLLEGSEREEWFRKACELGDDEAMGQLAVLLRGRGDMAGAEEWYRRAADAGSQWAAKSLARLLCERGAVDKADCRRT